MKGFKVFIFTAAFLWRAETISADTHLYHEFRQERAQSADLVRQDMRQSLQRLKAVAEAQGQTLPIAKDDLNKGLLGLDPKQLRKKLFILPPRERHEAIAFYQQVRLFLNQTNTGPSRNTEAERMELRVFLDQLQRNVDHLASESGTKIKPVKAPKPKKGK